MPRGWFGRGFRWFGWGRGFGNPYPFCRWFPWLPRWWWAYPTLITPFYYGAFWSAPYTGYRFPAWPYRVPLYTVY